MTFAPAFAKKRKVEADDDLAATPKYARHQNTDQQNGTFWIEGGTAENRWVRNEDLLQNRPTTAFEANNQGVLGMNANYSNIKTAHGSVAISTDGRAMLAKPDDTSRDGGNHGRPKKRHIKEWTRRYNEREDEKALWREKLERWNAMPEEAREEKRNEARENIRLMMERFQVEAVDEVPTDYRGDPFEMGHLSHALDTGDTASETSTAPASVAAFTISDPRRAPHHSALPFHESRTQSPRHQRHRGTNQLYETTPYGGSSLATPTTIALTYRPRLIGSSASLTPSASVLDMSTRFEVTEHPDYIPFEDCADIDADGIRDREARIHHILDLNSRKGRVVTVRLAEAVSLEFSQAIAGRLFGGLVQEIQFFPATRYAVICFLTPVSASAFVRHINNTRHNSQHEYRRLQIAATWYGDNERAAIFPGQNGIIRAAVYDNATRVLQVSGIAKSIGLGDITNALKQDIGVGRLVVKSRLIRPTKVYVRQAPGSTNDLIVEMRSMRDAIEVKSLINTVGLKEIPGAKAEFYKDPVDAPVTMRDFCDCKYCMQQGSTARSGQL